MQLHPPSTANAEFGSTTGKPEAASPSRGWFARRSRRFRWIVGILSAILLLLFVPPLVNANRYRREIARSMSESLGRPVHLDNVGLHLLPVPGITITNLVVDEDPAFGEEPTIRANTVEATLRLGSLWRHRVEFSTVRFVEPSVNLVRNPEGRWNLSEVLVNASKLDAAPTGQQKAGPAPRFPYIEATAGRVNIKFGENKSPFSLTDTDFALWLPTANQWRVRLKGAPARTDTSIDEPGVLRIEGAFERAATAADVPVTLRASWHDVPLGGASRFLTGEDSGWRGTLDLDLRLEGHFGDAQMRSQVTLDGLRRAEFSPAHPLDLQLTCDGGLRVEGVLAHDVQCTLPDDAPEPMLLRAQQMDLTHPAKGVLTLTGEQIPLHWGMLWAALFSPRVPTDLHPGGTLSVHFVRGLAPVPAPGREAEQPTKRRRKVGAVPPSIEQRAAAVLSWTGEVDLELPALPPASAAAAGAPTRPGAPPVELVWKAKKALTDPAGQGPHAVEFSLEPVSVPLGSSMTLAMTASVGPSGYTFSAAGSATAAALLLPARYLPQLGDGLEQILPYPSTGPNPVRVDFTCSRSWAAAQTCTAIRPTTVKGRPTGVGATLLPAPQGPAQPPSLLMPRSLSPLDANPALGGPPPENPPAPLPHP